LQKFTTSVPVVRPNTRTCGKAATLAVDLGQYGIRNNCVLPGMIKTDRWYNSPAQQNSLTARTPLGDIAEFEDIAEAAWYLGSDASRNTTGAER